MRTAETWRESDAKQEVYRLLTIFRHKQGLCRFLHPELARRERGFQKELCHTWVLLCRHVKYVLHIHPTGRTHTNNRYLVMALVVTYLPIFLPPVGGKQASGTEAPAPVPLA